VRADTARRGGSGGRSRERRRTDRVLSDTGGVPDRDAGRMRRVVRP
jgi:hypothetical protein